MKTEYCLVIIACICIGLVRAEVPSAAVSAASPTFNPLDEEDYINLNVALFDDIMVHPAVDRKADVPNRIHIRRRDSNGFYQLLHDLENLSNPGFAPITNGKWLTMVGTGSSMYIGQFDADFNVNMTSLGTSPIVGAFYSDDTFAYFNNKASSVRTIEFADGAWNEVDAVALGYPATFLGQSVNIGNYYLTTTYFNDTFNELLIYQRQANRTWIRVDSIELPEDYVANPDGAMTLYDGVDTIVLSSSSFNTGSGIEGATGLLTIYKKTSGAWSLQQQFTLLDLGVTTVGGGGSSLAMPDRNTILYGVPLTRNYTDLSTYPLGKVFVIRKNDVGQWAVTGTLYTNDRVIFGYSVFSNQYDYIITGLDAAYQATLYSIPKCYDTPINVTCDNISLENDCQFEVATLYALNNPECGATTATIKTLEVVSANQLEVNLEFSRYATKATCTVQITCPASPSAPAAVGVPVANTPSTKTSTAAQHVIGKALLISLAMSIL